VARQPAVPTVTGIVHASDKGLLPRRLPLALLILIGGWIVFLFVWGFTH